MGESSRPRCAARGIPGRSSLKMRRTARRRTILACYSFRRSRWWRAASCASTRVRSRGFKASRSTETVKPGGAGHRLQHRTKCSAGYLLDPLRPRALEFPERSRQLGVPPRAHFASAPPLEGSPRPSQARGTFAERDALAARAPKVTMRSSRRSDGWDGVPGGESPAAPSSTGTFRTAHGGRSSAPPSEAPSTASDSASRWLPEDLREQLRCARRANPPSATARAASHPRTGRTLANHH